MPHHFCVCAAYLAGMPEAERMAVIENIIAQVIAREEAERKAAEEAERETNRLQMREEAESQLPATSIISKPGQGNTTTPQTTQPAIGGKQDWYFYNPQLVEQGKAEFQRLCADETYKSRIGNLDAGDKRSNRIVLTPGSVSLYLDNSRSIYTVVILIAGSQ